MFLRLPSTRRRACVRARLRVRARAFVRASARAIVRAGVRACVRAREALRAHTLEGGTVGLEGQSRPSALAVKSETANA